MGSLPGQASDQLYLPSVLGRATELWQLLLTAPLPVGISPRIVFNLEGYHQLTCPGYFVAKNQQQTVFVDLPTIS